MSDISPVEFGRVIGHLESIQRELVELRNRTISRMDNMEVRIEVLERADVRDTQWARWAERAMIASVGMGVAYALKAWGML